MMLVPDHVQGEIYKNDIEPHLTAGKTLMFAHGFNIHFGFITPPKNIDVTMIAPKAPGHRVREVFTEGQGVPAWSPIHQDARATRSRTLWPTAAASAACGPGIIETSFKEETETDLFGEQAVLCGGVSELIRAGFRNAGRGRICARNGLFRVPARSEADCRSDL